MKGIFKFLVAIGVLIGLGAMTVNSQAETSYFRELSDRKVAFLSDGFYSVCLLLGVADKYNNFESQKNFLKEKGMLPAKLTDLRPEAPLRKGVAAYMFCRALEIKGGAVLRVFGASERYALRELVFNELMKEGHPREVVNGKELLSILLRASDYKVHKG